MNSGKTIFAQLMDFIPAYEFRKCVERYNGNYKIKSFSCWDQYLCMAFAQLTYRESLRDIEACLRAAQPKLYHLGIRGKVSRNTLANANQVRDWRIYADFAQILIAKARKLYANDSFGIELDQTVYALDSTTIDLVSVSVSLGRVPETQGSSQTAYPSGSCAATFPSVVIITHGKVHDVNILDRIDHRGRSHLHHGSRLSGFRPSVQHSSMRQPSLSLGQRPTSAANGSTPIRSTSPPASNAIRLSSSKASMRRRTTRRNYGASATSIPRTDKTLVFLTNNFTLPALTIADLYRCRWQVELFFKWIKQHLRIKAFYGTTENAVKTQIWIAISVYVLVAIIKKNLETGPEPLHNFTDFERHSFRENAHFTGTLECILTQNQEVPYQ